MGVWQRAGLHSSLVTLIESWSEVFVRYGWRTMDCLLDKHLIYNAPGTEVRHSGCNSMILLGPCALTTLS